MLDFSKVNKAEEKVGGYAAPGIWICKFKDATFMKPEGKSMYIEVLMERVKDGATFKTKLYLTENPATHERLQGIHETWFGKPVAKNFKDYNEAGEYFEKVFKAAGDKYQKMVVVGGKIDAKDRVWSELAYPGYPVVDKEVEEQEFQVGTEAYNRYVKRDTNAKAAPKTDDTFIPAGNSAPTDNGDSDDLPF